MPDHLASLTRDGYVTIPNVIGDEFRSEVYCAIERLFPKMDDSRLDLMTMSDRLVFLRSWRPEEFSRIYDQMLESYALKKLCYRTRLGEIAADLLGAHPASMWSLGTVLRMDAPHDKKHTYGWHQDAGYNQQNRSGLNSLVCWCPLQDVDEKNGTLMVLKGSHHEPTIEVPDLTIGKAVSTRGLIPPAIIERYDTVHVRAQAGDAVFFYSSLIHRSGHNSSERMRLTAQVRFHNMASGDFQLT